ncbi:MAG: hypothetical protein O7E54_02995 [Planctomycetota bacterium]|nr:hypothetical protein [Planctomycetota bacterium]
MDIDFLKDIMMGRDELEARLGEFEEQTPETFDGLLAGGHTAKALVIGVLRLALRVYELEERFQKQS